MIEPGVLRIGQLGAVAAEHLPSAPTSPPRRFASPIALVALLEAADALVHVGRAAVESIHLETGLGTGQLGVLRALARFGPQTVPQMARRRSVTRQHIQALVNLLAERSYVELCPNPAHKRSHLVRTTEKGEQLLRAIERRETKLLDALGVAVQDADLRTATEMMETVRKALLSERWSELSSQAPNA